jgi:paraquat-inducible protein A
VSAYPAHTAAARGLAICHVCAKLSPADLHRCPRCGAGIHLRTADSIARTVALVLTAIILYVPANVLPIMTTEQLGTAEDSTIIGGVIYLWHHGSYPVAVVIFIASVMVPLGKMIAILYLCWTVGSHQQTRPRQRTVMYRITEFVGRWSMVDVFVVAILVALIQLGGLLSITPGAAALAFSGVVIITMLAAESFDPRLIWDRLGDDDE